MRKKIIDLLVLKTICNKKLIMATNPGYDYFNAKDRYETAKTPNEQLSALQDMLKFAPKHKASEKLIAGINGKIAKLKQDIEKQRTQSKKTSGPSLNVKKDGDGQIVILGLPNTGKSFLLKKLTNVEVEIADYPFTTTNPEIGMLDYNGAKIQLVEVPAIINGSSEGKANGTQLLSLARNADAIIITYKMDFEKDVVINELEKVGIIVTRKKPNILINPSPFKGITLSGKENLTISLEEFHSILKSFGVQNASIILQEKTNIQNLTEALDEHKEYKNCLFVKADDTSKQEIGKKIFEILDKIIIYTKKPGQDAERTRPVVLKKDSTISDVAELVHKDIAKNLKYAKVWGSSKFPGQRVAKTYTLQNEDVIEFS